MIRDVSRSVYIPGRVRLSGFQKPRRADWPLAFRRRLGAAAMNPLAAQQLAAAITTQEGFYPGSLSYRNNNPGNLMYAGQAGATPGPGGFAVFDTLASGQAALLNQINLDAVRGTDVNGNPTVTVAQFLSSYAPAAGGNDTPAYIANVSAATGFSPDEPLLSLGAGSIDFSGDAADLTWQLVPAAAAMPAAGWWLAAGVGFLLLFR